MRRFRSYFNYLRPVRGPILIAILCGVIYGASSGAGLPMLVNYVFPRIFTRAGPILPFAQVLLIAGAIPMIFGLRALSGYFNSYFTQFAGVRILEALRLDYFRKLQALPLSFVGGKQTGDLISRGLSDT